MKLYLSSMDLGDATEHLVALVGANKKAAIIMNAGDGYGDERRPAYRQAYVRGLAGLGFSGEELDLRRYFRKPDALRTELSRFGLLWVVGGNSFVLRRAMKLSGLDEILPNSLKNSDLVYGGFSAGSCMVTPSLHGIEYADDPHEVPPGYSPDVVWEGLNLVDFHIAPHFQSPHPEAAAIDQVVDYFEKHRLPYKALVDGEAIVVNGEKIEIVGRASGSQDLT